MKVEYGDGRTEFGPGVSIKLDGNEIASAIDAYLVAHGIHVSGPRTISIDNKVLSFCAGEVYVDPSGFVIKKGRKFSGRGKGK